MLRRRTLEFLAIICLAVGLAALGVALDWLDETYVPLRNILLADRTGLTFWVIALGFWMLRTAVGHTLTLQMYERQIATQMSFLTQQNKTATSPTPFLDSLSTLSATKKGVNDPLTYLLQGMASVIFEHSGRPSMQTELDLVKDRLSSIYVSHYIRLLTVAGFLGTLVGFMLILYGIEGLEEPGQLGRVLSSAVGSFAVAAYTSLAGGIFGLIAFLIDERLAKRTEALYLTISDFVLHHVNPRLEIELGTPQATPEKSQKTPSMVGVLLVLTQQVKQLGQTMEHLQSDIQFKGSIDALRNSLDNVATTQSQVKRMLETIYRVPAKDETNVLGLRTNHQRVKQP